MHDLFILLTVFVIFSPAYIIFAIVDNYKKPKTISYTKEYYLVKNDSGEEYLRPYDLSLEGIKSPEQTKYILDNEEHEIFYDMGDIPVVHVYYVRDSGRMSLKELLSIYLPIHIVIYVIYAILWFCVNK